MSVTPETERATLDDVIRGALTRMRDDRGADPGELREYAARNALDALDALSAERDSLRTRVAELEREGSYDAVWERAWAAGYTRGSSKALGERDALVHQLTLDQRSNRELREALAELTQSCTVVAKPEMVRVPRPEVVWRARAAIARATEPLQPPTDSPQTDNEGEA